MCEWTLPSDSRPRKCSVPPAAQRDRIACQVCPGQIVPSAIARSTSLAPWS
jgi:hypothetical protein